VNIQTYATQLAETVMEEKQAKGVSVLVMNPKNGEIYACVDVPEYDLNDPFTLSAALEAQEDEDTSQMDLLNQMWRNTVVSDTYEPGSTFKIFTASAALEEGVVSLSDTFYCGGSIVVADRSIRCARTTGHGAETFVQGIENSCNPVFIQVGLRLGTERFCSYFDQFGLNSKTGIDLPGEAATIMHRVEDMGDVELATCSFGQSFQLTRLRLLTTVCELINGGISITPHFGVALEDEATDTYTQLEYPAGEQIVSSETSMTMRYLLECVVSEGGGANGQVEGYAIGGKTATSEKLPRGTGKYISSFIGIAPADDPQVITLLTIDEPVGTYYGGIIAAPVVSELYENILPYLGVPQASASETP
jgi:stage V sporulation protein D (sporulation-specific penicillin-binding protein)